jgi:hypothetical protein
MTRLRDYAPQDPTNLAADRALSNFDERHKVVVASVIESPWRNAVRRRFELAPNVQYHSGHPFNLLAGEAVNGDNHPTTGRPVGANRSTGIGPGYADFDARLTRVLRVTEYANLQLLSPAQPLGFTSSFPKRQIQLGLLLTF